MSRAIKFRAWDKGSKRYGEVVEIEYNESREIDEVWVWYNIHERYEPIPGANAIVEQYTGLKDKNGEEIYEGDIVKVGSLKLTFEVAYNTPCTKFWMENNGLVEEFENWNEETGIEVIGNIHEPPKDFRPEHLKRMGVSISKGGKE